MASGSCLVVAQARRCSAVAQGAAARPRRHGLRRHGGRRALQPQRCPAPSPRGRRRRRARLISGMRSISAALCAAACAAYVRCYAPVRASHASASSSRPTPGGQPCGVARRSVSVQRKRGKARRRRRRAPQSAAAAPARAPPAPPSRRGRRVTWPRETGSLRSKQQASQQRRQNVRCLCTARAAHAAPRTAAGGEVGLQAGVGGSSGRYARLRQRRGRCSTRARRCWRAHACSRASILVASRVSLLCASTGREERPVV